MVKMAMSHDRLSMVCIEKSPKISGCVGTFHLPFKATTGGLVCHSVEIIFTKVINCELLGLF